MKKKIISIILIIILVINLTACESLLSIALEMASSIEEEILNTETYESTTYSNTNRTTNNGSTLNNDSTTSNESVTTIPTSSKDYSDYTYYDLAKANNDDWHFINSVGEQKVLIIPVTIKNYETRATSSTITDLNSAFFGETSETCFESLRSYYYKSSYGKLSISGTVLPWTSAVSTRTIRDSFDPVIEDTDSYIKSCGIDPKDYDSDGDGFIDCVFYIYSCDVYEESSGHGFGGGFFGGGGSSSIPDYFWAYSTYSDLEADVDSPKVNNYCLASVEFMYSDSGIDSHTYIHEYGHLMGLDDYYNADSSGGDAVGYSLMMSYNILDQDSFSKISLGWIDPIVVSSSTTLTLKSYSENAECIVISDDYGSCFSEYFVIEYYTPTNLNYADSFEAYEVFSDGSKNQGVYKAGVRIYRIDARVCTLDSKDNITILDDLTDYDGKETLYKVAHSNTPSYSMFTDYNGNITNRTESNKQLIELIDKSGRSHTTYDYQQNVNSLFYNGDSINLANYALNSGKVLNYTITFGEQTEDGIVVTIVKGN